jgi:Hypoxia induced protein conserved region
MATFFMILTAIFALLTLASLMVGVFSMGKAGEFNRKHGNKLMRMRVLFQLLTIACLIIAVLAYQAE